jgi:hypothetical protein
MDALGIAEAHNLSATPPETGWRVVLPRYTRTTSPM